MEPSLSALLLLEALFLTRLLMANRWAHRALGALGTELRRAVDAGTLTRVSQLNSAFDKLDHDVGIVSLTLDLTAWTFSQALPEYSWKGRQNRVQVQAVR